MVDHDSLAATLHDSAFMAVNAGEPLPGAEAMYRKAQRFARSNQPSFRPINDTLLGMLRLRHGDLEGGHRLLRATESPLRGTGEPFIELFRSCLLVRLGKTCEHIMPRPSA